MRRFKAVCIVQLFKPTPANKTCASQAAQHQPSSKLSFSKHAFDIYTIQRKNNSVFSYNNSRVLLDVSSLKDSEAGYTTDASCANPARISFLISSLRSKFLFIVFLPLAKPSTDRTHYVQCQRCIGLLYSPYTTELPGCDAVISSTTSHSSDVHPLFQE